jgi:RNA-directed DNA polymerase
MTAAKAAGASSTKPRNKSWKTLPWFKVKAEVFRLQTRIAKAEREGRRGKVKALRRLLTSSFYAKCLAVKRVISNTGGKTPGVDKVIWRTAGEKMEAVLSLKRRTYQPSPLRRIHIPKQSDKTTTRAISIPTLKLTLRKAVVKFPSFKF